MSTEHFGSTEVGIRTEISQTIYGDMMAPYGHLYQVILSSCQRLGSGLNFNTPSNSTLGAIAASTAVAYDVFSRTAYLFGGLNT